MPQKISLRSLKLDISGWQLVDESEEKLRLINTKTQDILAIWFFEEKPEIPPLGKFNKLLQHYQKEIKPRQGTILDLQTCIIDQCHAIKSIFKFPGQKGEGPVYLGSFSIPFKYFGFVIKIQATSAKDWQLREKFVKGKVQNEYPEDDKQRILNNWNQNPFGNRASGNQNAFHYDEHEEFDNMFPDHALSRTRKNLRTIEENLHIDEQVKDAAPYPFKSKSFLSGLFKGKK